MKKTIVFLTFVVISFCLNAQSPQSWSSAEMYLALRKLNVTGAVLYVAAHPDDENTRLITYFSKEKLYRTGYLSLTRGDGGQNLIGDEQGVELGLIRTQELLAARRIDGGEQFFTRAIDFGYSKTPEETFSKWNKEKILSDVVWVIRRFQPDIIVTRFPVTGEGGHGHHTASAILANEAFTAAADATKFPEQLRYVKTWQAKRILFNSFNFGGNNTITNNQFKIEVGGYNPLLGKSYGEIAAESRSQHKSQGFGVPASRGESFDYFSTTGGQEPVSDIMDGVDVSWTRVPGGAIVAKKVEELIAAFDILQPEKSVKGLVELYQLVTNLPEGNWKQQKLEEIQTLIVQCSGLFIDVTTTVPYVVQSDSVRLNFSFINRAGADVMLDKVKLDHFDSTVAIKLQKNKNLVFYKTLPVTVPVTQPYWLQQQQQEGYFTVNDQLLIGRPDIVPAYTATVEITIAGQVFHYPVAVKYKYTSPVRGELYEPLTVLPAVEVNFVKENTIVQNNKAARAQLLVNANKETDSPYEIVTAFPTTKWKADKSSFTYTPAAKATTNYSININALQKNSASDRLSVQLKKGNAFEKAIQRKKIAYEHIPDIVYFKEAATQLTQLELKTEHKTIGYITGAGDKVPEALAQMGYQVVLLSDKELATHDLSRFDAILTGVRAYNTHEWMSDYYDKLMEYVKNGGNLIVQYNTNSNAGPLRLKIGPYPFTISRTRVTDEQAAVTFVNPAHRVLNYPNKITQQDFQGWVQERSIYHAAGWDKTYETVLSMGDPGEKADSGSLIIGKYGKGYFTYTGLVFFRELPAGVPGAYRLLANLIALNTKKAF